MEYDTIGKIAELFKQAEVNIERDGHKVYLTFPVSDKWSEPAPQLDLPLIGDGKLDEASGINLKRQMKNVITSLVRSPQFHRCTATAHHLTQFYFKYGKEYGIEKIIKKDGPLTMIFSNHASAISFIKLVS